MNLSNLIPEKRDILGYLIAIPSIDFVTTNLYGES